MLRPLLINAVAKARSLGFLDTLLRTNPILRTNIDRTLRLFAEGDATALNTQLEYLLKRVLKAAKRTDYGMHRTLSLDSWPVLEKSLIVNNPQKFISAGSLVRIPAGTGGTSGVPMELWRSMESIVAEQAFLDALLSPYGTSLLASSIAVLRADPVKPAHDTQPPYGLLTHQQKRLVLSSMHLSSETLPWYLDTLKDFSPKLLWVYPSAILNLMTLMEKAGASLRIPLILTSSEVLSADMHRRLAAFFDATVINYYGQAERVCFAYSKTPGEFYFHPCYGKVELPLHDGLSHEHNQQVRKIIGTSYWNCAMPLVRYNTSDLLYLPSQLTQEEVHAIALGQKPFSAIAGRDGEYILTREGLRLIGLNHIPREVEHVSQIQLVQHTLDHVSVDVLTLPGFGEKERRQLRDQARAKLPTSITIDVQEVNQLRTTERGKTPFVIRLVS